MNPEIEQSYTKDQILELHMKQIEKDYPVLFGSEAGRAELKKLLAETITTTRAYTREALAENVMENMRALVQQDIDQFKDEGIGQDVIDSLAKDPTGAAIRLVAQSHQLILGGLEFVLFNEVGIEEDCHDPECEVHHVERIRDDLLEFGTVRGEA